MLLKFHVVCSSYLQELILSSSVSYMEIYNENIRDLFVKQSMNLKIKETEPGVISVAGLKEEVTTSPSEVNEQILT